MVWSFYNLSLVWLSYIYLTILEINCPISWHYRLLLLIHRLFVIIKCYSCLTVCNVIPKLGENVKSSLCVFHSIFFLVCGNQKANFLKRFSWNAIRKFISSFLTDTFNQRHFSEKIFTVIRATRYPNPFCVFKYILSTNNKDFYILHHFSK